MRIPNGAITAVIICDETPPTGSLMRAPSAESIAASGSVHGRQRGRYS